MWLQKIMVVSLALLKLWQMFTHKQLEFQLHVWRGLLKAVVNEAWTCQHDITWTSNSTRGLQVMHSHNHTYVNTYHLGNTHTVIRCHHRVRKNHRLSHAQIIYCLSLLLILATMLYEANAAMEYGHGLTAAVVPKCIPTDSRGSATTSHGIRGYISVMTTLKFTFFQLIECLF
jgi:hypothetical protein